MKLNDLPMLFAALGVNEISHLSLLSAEELRMRHVPPFPADAPALVLGLEVFPALTDLERILSTVYPGECQLKLVNLMGQVETCRLAELGGKQAAAVLVPSLGEGTAFEAFQEIIAHLRAPDGCPWDREQTHLSLRQHLLEESYETLAALDEADPAKTCEEFGDLLLQIVLNAQIAVESGEFTMAEVIHGIYAKIVRRHPHVFGEVEVAGVGQVLSNWENIKKEERNKKGEGEKSLLDSLPAALPALTQAQEFQSRAARVGFDWPEIDGVLAKVVEEIEEVRAAANPEELADELGDLFFALVNLARWKKIDAESALREASLKFKRRFKHVEARAREAGRPMTEMTIEELDAFWNEAKGLGL